MLKKSINKINLINKLRIKTGFSANYSKKLIDDLIKIIILNIKNGNFILKNIGSFKLIKKNKRIGRNPKTKEEFIISARKSISFIPSQKLLKKLNNFHE